MKKQNLELMLRKPVHPVVGKAVLGAGILLTAIAFVLVLQQQAVSPTLTKQKEASPRSTPAPTFNPANFALTPTPTLAPGQKAIYSFYIQATSTITKSKGIDLTQSDTGKVFTVDIGTLLIVNFGRVGKSHVSALSPQAIFTNYGRPETIHLPNNALGAFRVYRAGFGTIRVTETD